MARNAAALGGALAKLHSAGADFGQRRPNALSLDGWRRLAEQIGDGADRFEPGLGNEIVTALETLGLPGRKACRKG